MSNTYWAALKALGSLPDKSSLALLSQAVNDHAPDKREQALLSLQTVLLSQDLQRQYQGNLEELVRARMDDPAVGVQAAALTGVAQHNLKNLVPESVRALLSRESAIQRRASETLQALARNGHRDTVKESLEANISKEHDSSKKHKLNKVLEHIALS